MSAEDTIAYGNRGHTKRNNRVECADGFSLSVVAGGGIYCSPRPAMCACGVMERPNSYIVDPERDEVEHDYPGPYTHVEVGFPSARPEPWAEWEQYVENSLEPTNTVYSYVPVDLVRQLIADHGGEL